MDDLFKTLRVSAAGMKAQGTRLRVISENIANADSLPQSPGAAPYQRQQMIFRNALDREIGLKTVRASKVTPDTSEFEKRYEPNHSGADASGYVEVPNVNPLIEMMDMREAERSYDANMSVIKSTKRMLQGTIDILK